MTRPAAASDGCARRPATGRRESHRRNRWLGPLTLPGERSSEGGLLRRERVRLLPGLAGEGGGGGSGAAGAAAPAPGGGPRGGARQGGAALRCRGSRQEWGVAGASGEAAAAQRSAAQLGAPAGPLNNGPFGSDSSALAGQE